MNFWYSFHSVHCSVSHKCLSMIGVPHLNHKDSFQGHQNSPFFHFPHDLFYISPFFFMSNEIILVQILYKLKKYLLFSLIKVRIIKFIQCKPCLINGLKFLEIWLFEIFYITIRHWVLVKFIHFIHIRT